MATQKLDLAKDSTMTKVAQVLANAVRKNAPHAGIRKSVRIGRREGRGTSKFITVLVGKAYVPGSGAKGSEYAARAFDIGSGIHGKTGQTYTITARNAPNLVFFWKRENKLFKGRTVEHPGVVGTGYIKESVNESRPKIRQMLLKDSKESLRLYLRAEFRNFGK